MGKKVSPHSFRIGITRGWDSRWYAKKGYKDQFLEDVKIREFLTKKLAAAGISKIEIERLSSKNIVIVHAAKPGIIIGRGGEEIGKVQDEIFRIFGTKFEVTVNEVKKPDMDAQLIANSVAEQIEKRFHFRRVMKMAVERGRESGAKGVKVKIGGRLNGVDIARTEVYSDGTVPLHTLRADIDYAIARAETTYGTIGVKVWVYRGMVFKNKDLQG